MTLRIERLRHWVLALVLTLGMMVLVPVAALGDEAVTPDPGPSGSTIPVPQSMSFTGAATQSVPIIVPPGRNGIGPNLSLTYNSYQKNGWIGVGWSLEMGAIQRSTKRGFDCTKDEFVASINGSTSELVPDDDWGAGYYRAKVEGAFSRYYFDEANNMWTVTTKDGTVYTYGGDNGSRQYNPSNPSCVFKWCLTRVEDPNGNYMEISYANQYTAAYGDNQIYLEEVSYTGNDNRGHTPDYKVSFILDDTVRPDVSPSFVTHYPISTSRRLGAIEVYGPDANGVETLVRSYAFSYTESPDTGRSLLSGIQQLGDEGGSLPTVTFDYQEGDKSFCEMDFALSQADMSAVGAYAEHPGKIYAVDVNGDKRTDLVMGPNPSGVFQVLLNHGIDLVENDVALTREEYDAEHLQEMLAIIPPEYHDQYIHYFDYYLDHWTPADFLFGYPAFERQEWTMSLAALLGPNPGDYSGEPDRIRWIDVMGDGQADLVVGPIPQTEPGNGVFVYFESTGAGFAPGVFLNAVSTSYGGSGDSEDALFAHGIYGLKSIRPMDFNGDGKMDIVAGPRITPCGYGYTVNYAILLAKERSGGSIGYEVFHHEMAGCVDTEYGTGYAMHVFDNFTSSQIRPLDINGDGYTDLLFGPSDSGQWNTWISNGADDFVSDYSFVEPLISPPDDPSNPVYDTFGDNTDQFNFADVNGDGLSDMIVIGGGGNLGVWINTGKTFSADTADGGGTWFSNSTFDHMHDHTYRVRFSDVNGDGMADVVYQSGSAWTVFQSTGHSFELQSGVPNSSTLWSDYAPTAAFDDVDATVTYQRRFVTLNGDGRADILLGPTGAGRLYGLQVGGGFPVMPDLLKKVNNGQGGFTEITYSPSTMYPDVNHKDCPFVVQTTSRITINDGMGNSYSTDYAFKDPAFDYERRDFLGFAENTRTNPDGSLVVSRFHQDEYRKGRTYREELYTDSASLEAAAPFGTTTYTWTAPEATPPSANGMLFVKLEKKTVDFSGDGVVTTETYDYDDTHGGITRKEVFAGTDENTGEKAVSVTTWVNKGVWKWRMAEERLQDAAGAWERKTTYVYNNVGNLTEKRYYKDASTYVRETFTYDGYGLVKGGLTPRNVAKPTVVYDPVTHTFPHTVTNVLGHVVTKNYDYGLGQVINETDPNGNVTYYVYDEFGRLTRAYSTDAQGMVVADARTEYHLDQLPRYLVQKVHDTAAATIDSYTFLDGLGRTLVTATKGENGQVIAATKHYDNMSRNYRTDGPYVAAGVSFPLSAGDYETLLPPAGDYDHPWAQTLYDERGRPEKVQSPDASGEAGQINEVTYVYDGYSTRVIDPDACSKTEVKDYLGRVVQVIEHADAGDQVTIYDYNLAGDLEKVTDALGNETINNYDKLGRKENMTDPDMGFWQYTYDANGNLDVQTDAKGSRIRFHYDDLDRVTWKEYLDTDDPDVFYDYDNLSIPNGKGRLYQVSKKDSLPAIAVSETTYADGYDALGQAISVTKSIQTSTGLLTDYTTGYQYDMAGRITQMVYPDDTQVEYGYFPGTSLLEKVTSPDPADPNGYPIEHALFSGYSPGGKMGNIYYHNGTQTDYTYDAASGRLTGIVTNDINCTVATRIQEKRYTYTGAGDVKGINDIKVGITRTYAYDKLHRLINETSDSGAEDDFDTQDIVPVYPLSGETQINGVKYPVHAAKALSVNGESRGYEYDANGNMTVGWDAGNGLVRRGFTYNADNMPTEIVHETLGTTTYTYDESGQRVKKSGPGNTIYYVGGHYEVKNGAPVKYIFAGNIRLAMVNASGTFYYHKDHLGSTAALSDMNGGIYGDTSAYLPFGGQRKEGGVTSTAYMFTDQERDAESGLYNYNARLYDPVIGQFITPDSIVQNPFDPQTLNRYSYCRNNSLIYVDPSGHSITAVIVGAVIGAIAAGAQSDWNPEAMLVGAVIGGISGGTFSGVEGAVSNIAWVTQSGASGIISGAAGGAAAGAVSGGLSAAYYGGDIGQSILSGAGFGALGGGVFGGIGFPDSPWKVAAYAGAGGGISALSGGDFWEGAAFSGGIALASWAYSGRPNLETGKGTQPNKSHGVPCQTRPDGKPYATVGLSIDKINSISSRVLRSLAYHTVGEGGFLMQTIEYIPGATAFGRFHDHLHNLVKEGSILNKPPVLQATWGVAAPITYGAILGLNPMLSLHIYNLNQ